MASQDRRERERQATRCRIMDAARELFATQGFEAVSLRKIADAIEYTPAAIYVHFADKEALFRELASEDFRKMASILPVAGTIDDPLLRIAMIGRAYIEFGLKHPNHYRLMFMTRPACPPVDGLTEDELRVKNDPAQNGYLFLRNCVVDAMQRGLLRPDVTNPDLAAQTFWAGVHGVTSLQIALGDDPWIDWASTERRIAAICWTLVRGMARHPENYDMPIDTPPIAAE